MLSEELTQQVQVSIDLVALISTYLPLQQSRKALKGNCPFHADSSYSLMVVPNKNNFKCFGCGKEGGAIEFVMLIEGKSEEATVEKLARKLGISERKSA